MSVNSSRIAALLAAASFTLTPVLRAQQTIPGPAAQTSTDTKVDKSARKAEHKQQKAQEKAANQTADAAKQQAKAQKQEDKAQKASEKAQDANAAVSH